MERNHLVSLVTAKHENLTMELRELITSKELLLQFLTQKLNDKMSNICLDSKFIYE